MYLVYNLPTYNSICRCPLAMTDGAAKTLLSCDQSDKEISNAYQRLISRNPEKFWTSGQWMTEKRGGSDVRNATETEAIPNTEVDNSGKSFFLFGTKWFSSAADSDMALVLAKRETRIDLFYVRTRDPNDNKKLNGIRFDGLKNKLGTRQLPTAELILDGAKATLLSKEGHGISRISDM